MVASDVAEIIRVGSELGLSLNITKCELIAHNDLLVSDTLLESFHRVKIADAPYWDHRSSPVPHLTKRGVIGVKTSLEQPIDCVR